jgi:hypothetical protein
LFRLHLTAFNRIDAADLFALLRCVPLSGDGMTSAEQGAAGPSMGPTPLKPHLYPIWILGFTALVIGAVVYSATLTPPYLEALVALRHGHEAIRAKDRAAAESHYLDVLQLIPSSKAARLELAILLLAEPSEARQRRGLDYLTGIQLDKHDWQRVSAVLPDKFRGAFTTTSKR